MVDIQKSVTLIPNFDMFIFFQYSESEIPHRTLLTTPDFPELFSVLIIKK